MIAMQEPDTGTFWERAAKEYVHALDNDYHSHRLAVIRALIPAELRAPGKRIFDFGCGDGVLFPEFLAAEAEIQGCDTSPAMVDMACERLGRNLVSVGGVEPLACIPDASLDGLFAFNVLAYLDDDAEFYEQARRIVKPGGYLVVTHCNELFELFGLNSYTVDFFRRHLVASDYHDDLPDMLYESRRSYSIRENPLTYWHKLAAFGFRETRQEFINWHDAPPRLLSQRHFRDTLAVPDEDRWKLLFACSSFGSCAVQERR